MWNALDKGPAIVDGSAESTAMFTQILAMLWFALIHNCLIDRDCIHDDDDDDDDDNIGYNQAGSGDREVY